MTSIPATSGIYKIACTVTGKFYIGSSINLRKRCYEHFRQLRNKTHINPKLQHAFDKHGEQTFLFEVLELVLPMFLTTREQYWFDTLHPEYNVNLAADSRLGMMHTPESREKNRQSHLGKPVSPEARAKLSTINLGNTRALGNKLSLETRKQMSQARMGNTINLGRKLSLEHRQKIGQASLGREVSPATREKHRNRKHTPEARAKMSQAMIGNQNGLGKIPSPEKRKKISQAHLGRKHTPEQNEQHRQAMTGRKYDTEVYANRRKTFILTDPSGTEHLVCDLRAFCKEHNLNNSHLIQVAKGRSKQHKGWKARYPD